MTLHAHTVPHFHKDLGNLSAWLDEAKQHAEDNGYDVEVLVESRLAPDMSCLRQQVQTACDSAKLRVARLAGVEAPKHEDGPQSLAELQARIAQVQDWMGTVEVETFEAGVNAVLEPGFLRGMRIQASDLATHFSVPNVFFRVSMAYAILRHNGVKLGKMQYIGSLPAHQA